jgi:peptide/nickel transport system permease protein
MSSPGRLTRLLSKGGGSRRLLLLGVFIVVAAIVVAVIGPFIAPYDPTAVSLGDRLLPPSSQHWLGTDQLGRDILSRMLHAGRVTITIAIVSVILAGSIGVLIGSVSGYFGGRLDLFIQRIVDIQLAFPTILLAITVVAVLGSSVPILIFVFVLAGWVRYVRVIRAQTMVIRETQYVEAAKSVGNPPWRILRKYVTPNLLTDILALVNLEVARVVLLESGLSYLGLGVQPPLPTWGNMLNDGRLYIGNSWWFVTFPGLAIVAVVLGVTLVAEGLRAVYDPREQRAAGVVDSSEGMI